MRVMVLVKATEDSEKGILPAMGKYRAGPKPMPRNNRRLSRVESSSPVGDQASR